MSLFLEYYDYREGSSCYYLLQNLVECVACWFDLAGMGLPCCTTPGSICSAVGLCGWPPAVVQCTDKVPYALSLDKMQWDLLLN